MTPDRGKATLKPVTIRLSEADIEAWDRVARWLYPLDEGRRSQVVRDLIRDADARRAAAQRAES